MDFQLASRCVDLARELTQLHAGSTPPFSLDPLVQHFGITEVRERPLDRDARLIRESGQLFIEVNSLFPLVRRRLSIAHEIGHLIVSHCSGVAVGHRRHEDPFTEALCNQLAGRLLAPDWALEMYFERETGLADWRSKVGCSTIISAASKFAISVDAAASRICRELGLAPHSAAIIWRNRENSVRPGSEKVLRIASSWHSRGNSIYIPQNKTAPESSVIMKASRQGGVFSAVEDLSLGTLRGWWQVEALGFGPYSNRTGTEGVRSVLSLASPLCGATFSTAN